MRYNRVSQTALENYLGRIGIRFGIMSAPNTRVRLIMLLEPMVEARNVEEHLLIFFPLSEENRFATMGTLLAASEAVAFVHSFLVT